jgi:predicted DNA-binding protein
MEKKYKRGDVREDGMVFRNYTGRGTEWWVTPEELAAMRERNKSERKNYYKKNKEAVAESNRKWSDKNPGRKAQLTKEWRQKNKEYVNAVSREWKKNNSEKVKEMIESRIQKDRDSYLAERRMARAKRRAILKERLHPDHNFELEKVLTDQCKRLYKKFGVKFEVDHIVPLDKGGWHHHLNLQVIPMVWNRRKHTKDKSVLPDCWINK